MSSTIKAAAKAPLKLSKVLAQLNAGPKLDLNGVKALRLSYAYRNDHWGARHFAKEHLPRIRWANPELDIEVEKVLKTKGEHWRPELEVHFENGQQQTFNLQGKWSTTIAKELMDVAGGPAWAIYKASTISSGQPLFPGEENETSVEKRSATENLPSLSLFRQAKAAKEASNTPILASPDAPQPTALV